MTLLDLCDVTKLAIDHVIGSVVWLRAHGVPVTAMSMRPVEVDGVPPKTRYALSELLPPTFAQYTREPPIPAPNVQSRESKCSNHSLYEVSRTMEGPLRVILCCGRCPLVVVFAPLVRDMRKKKVVAWREAKRPVGLSAVVADRLVADAHERLDEGNV
jgi:hypothetical protein